MSELEPNIPSRSSLRRIRLDDGKTMGDLARILDSSVSYIADLELGRADLGAEDVVKLALYFRVDTSAFDDIRGAES